MKFTTTQSTKLALSLDRVLKDITTFNGDSTPQLIAPGCTLGVTDRDSTVYLNSKGVRNIDDPVPVTNNDSYALFSCTKSLTVMGALILYEQGNSIRYSRFYIFPRDCQYRGIRARSSRQV